MNKAYVCMSVASCVVVLSHAVLQQHQFYPAMEYLSTSKLAVAVMGNMGFVLSLLVYHLVTRVFLGRLREYEVERVQDRVGQAIIETLLAMTIFRQNVESFSLVSQFVLLAFVKILHWLGQDRVDFIETTPHVPVLQHVRLMSMLVFLLVVDVVLLHVSLVNTLTHGVSVHLLFAFEYSMQSSLAMAALLKYVFSLVDQGVWHGSWRGRSVAVFYVDLTKDLVHLITYTAFFMVVFSTYGIPIHLIRDIYWTFRNFQMRVRDFLRYRQISANMENRFPDASEEDLVRADHTCIVCREDMRSGKRLPCHHVFHMECLKSWLERQQNCPICRSVITASNTSASDVAGEEQRHDGDEGAPQNGNARDDGAGEVAATNDTDDSSTSDTDSNINDADTGNISNDREAFLRRLEQQQQREVEGAFAQNREEVGRNSSSSSSSSSSSLKIEDEAVATTSATVDATEDANTNTSTHHEAPERVVPSSEATPPPPVQQQQQHNRFACRDNASPLPSTAGVLAVEDPDLPEKLRREAQDMGLHPTEEQHARAIAVARAAAQATTIAYTSLSAYAGSITIPQPPATTTDE